MKAYIYTILGLILSTISFILFLTLGQIYFIPLIFILPLNGVCVSKRDKGGSNYLNIEPLKNKSQNNYKIYECPYCNFTIHEMYPTYCPHCGKLLNRESDSYE